MDAFKLFVIENWTTILEYSLMFLAYFFVALCRINVGSTKKSLSALFKEEANTVRKIDRQMRKDIADERKIMYDEFTASIAAYDKAISSITDLHKRVDDMEKAFQILIREETEVDDNAKLHSDCTD